MSRLSDIKEIRKLIKELIEKDQQLTHNKHPNSFLLAADRSLALYHIRAQVSDLRNKILKGESIEK